MHGLNGLRVMQAVVEDFRNEAVFALDRFMVVIRVSEPVIIGRCVTYTLVQVCMFEIVFITCCARIINL